MCASHNGEERHAAIYRTASLGQPVWVWVRCDADAMCRYASAFSTRYHHQVRLLTPATTTAAAKYAGIPGPTVFSISCR